MEFELKYTAAQEEFRNEVRFWLAANVRDGITARPRTFEESHAIYLMRRELGRKLGAKGCCQRRRKNASARRRKNASGVRDAG